MQLKLADKVEDSYTAEDGSTLPRTLAELNARKGKKVSEQKKKLISIPYEMDDEVAERLGKISTSA